MEIRRDRSWDGQRLVIYAILGLQEALLDR